MMYILRQSHSSRTISMASSLSRKYTSSILRSSTQLTNGICHQHLQACAMSGARKILKRDTRKTKAAATTKEDVLDYHSMKHSRLQEDIDDIEHVDENDQENDDETGFKISPFTIMGRNRVGLCDLPKDLNDQVLNLLPSVNKPLREAAQSLYMASMSQARPTDYSTLVKRVNREGTSAKVTPEPHAVRYDEITARAYFATRTHAAYGAANFVFRDISRRFPDFKPTGVLDFGTGPGTAIWAAKNSWSESLQYAVGIDSSEDMLNRAEKLSYMPTSGVKDYKGIRYLNHRDKFEEKDTHDLVVASFVLGELPSEVIIKATLKTLWNQTRGILVLIDRGTPNGFLHIAEARAAILAMATPDDAEHPNAHVVSPCSHEKPCPMMVDSKSWCHYSQRIYRNEVVRSTTNYHNSDHEDIKFSYVAIRRGARPAKIEEQISTKSAASDLSKWSDAEKSTLKKMSLDWPRLTAPPMKKKKHVLIDMCTPEGQIHRVTATKQSSPFYKDARKLHWGDQWPHPPTSAVLIRAPQADRDHQQQEKSADKDRPSISDEAL
ncbi:hypothetical protein BSLG_002161 [Batrachochytrium salamandrivorans]|nr:hypothetical protein BSLG_002161 [Batrachochytrium salamandrivorans]